MREDKLTIHAQFTVLETEAEAGPDILHQKVLCYMTTRSSALSARLQATAGQTRLATSFGSKTKIT